MKPLRLTVPLGSRETPQSFASRLAARNGPAAREFCLDLGTTFQHVVDGNTTAIAIIAARGGVPEANLQSDAFVRGEKHRYRHRGEDMVRNALRRQAVAVCPRCLAEDIAASPAQTARVAPFGRSIWQIAAVKTCSVHLTPLVVIAKDLTPSTLHDWAFHFSRATLDLPRMVAEAVARPLTGLEAYVVSRLDSQAGLLPLLDSFPLHVAIAACELFGAVAKFGRTVNLKKLGDEEWRIAGGAGFDILADGKPGLEIFLEDLRDSYPYSGAATEGPQAVFGRIYQTLEFYREDKAYDPLRDLVGDFIRTRFPVGPGGIVFGKPVECRVLHSVRTLSVETRLHPKRLRKLLRAVGLLSADADDLAGGNCLFDAGLGSQAAKDAAAATLSVRKAGEYLNAPRVQRDMLYRMGLIVPRVRGAEHGAADKFAPEDLDAFLARLLDGAVAVDTIDDGQVNIPDAAKQACCGSIEIVRLLLDRKLPRKWRLAGERGYMSILVDVKEVRSRVRGPDKRGLTGSEIKDKLSTSTKVVAALIKHGHLKTITVVNPVNRCPTVVVPPEEVERFGREYVSLFALAKRQARHFREVKKRLEADGITPAIDPKKVGAAFYSRAVVMRDEGSPAVRGAGTPSIRSQ